ncbi:hypothetical protein HOJ01_00425 [bacterium]|jgi:hypothetical protein|nr:hypothetical protein [bacterium]MBT6293253.1 hypothetical protein [bacterium]
MERLQKRIKLSFVDYIVYGLSSLNNYQSELLINFQLLVDQVEKIEEELFSDELNVLSCLNKGDTVYFLKDYFNSIEYFLGLFNDSTFKDQIFKLIFDFKQSTLQSENLDQFVAQNQYLILDSKLCDDRSKLELFLKAFFSVEFILKEIYGSTSVKEVVDSLVFLNSEFLKIENKRNKLLEIYNEINNFNRLIVDSLVPRSFDTSDNQLRFYADDYLKINKFDSSQKESFDCLLRESIIDRSYDSSKIINFLRNEDE